MSDAPGSHSKNAETSAVDAEFAWEIADEPGLLSFQHEVPDEIAAAISECIGGELIEIVDPASSFRALRPVDGPVGRYRVATPTEAYFVRVSARQGNPPLEKEIVSHLVSRGAPVNAILIAGKSLRWEGRQLRVDVRPALEGRHFDGSMADLTELGKALASCHETLADYPGAGEIRLVASERAGRITGIHRAIARAVETESYEIFAELDSWARVRREWLGTMSHSFEPAMHERPDAQCLHGEVHPGNVIFDTEGGSATLFDFEESVHMFAPPAWDLAMAVQRFCLRDDPAQQLARERVEALLGGYGRSSGSLTTMMRQIAWFLVAVVVDLRANSGVVTPESECEKFVRLETQARSYEGLI